METYEELKDTVKEAHLTTKEQLSLPAIALCATAIVGIGVYSLFKAKTLFGVLLTSACGVAIYKPAKAGIAKLREAKKKKESQ